MDNKFRAWFDANYPGEAPWTRRIAWDAYLEGHARAVEAIEATKTRPGMEKAVRGTEGAATPIIPKRVSGDAIVWEDIQLQQLPERSQERP